MSTKKKIILIFGSFFLLLMISTVAFHLFPHVQVVIRNGSNVNLTNVTVYYRGGFKTEKFLPAGGLIQFRIRPSTESSVILAIGDSSKKAYDLDVYISDSSRGEINVKVMDSEVMAKDETSFDWTFDIFSDVKNSPAPLRTCEVLTNSARLQDYGIK